MKKNYLLFLFAIIFIKSYGQEPASNDIHSNLAEASMNITSGSETFNLEDLKYHAKRSLNAINQARKQLNSTSCSKVLELSNEIAGLLDGAILSEDHNEGLSYITLTRDLILQAFYEYDVCAVKGSSSGENEALTELQQQKSNLKLQQIELELKAKEIERQLAEQEEKETFLKKQKFIDLNEKVIASNLKAYNDLLTACDCNTAVSTKTGNSSELTSKSLNEIRTHYLNKVITISESYLDKLNLCKN